MHLHIGICPDIDGTGRVSERHAGSQVAADNLTLHRGHLQLVQPDIQGVTVIADARHDLQVDLVDDRLIILAEGEAGHDQWLNRVQVNGTAGIGRNLEGSGQCAVDDVVVRQENIKPVQRHLGQLKCQQDLLLVHERLDITQRYIEVSGQARGQRLRGRLVRQARVDGFQVQSQAG